MPDEITREIRDRADIVEVIGRYITLKRAGSNYKGLCPFHGEKTPSFNVNIDRQIFHCFGCGAGGDVIAFLMRQENLTFPEALRSLAGELGIVIPETSGGEPSGVADALYRANEVAFGFFRQELAGREAEGVRAYLAQRGVDAALAQRVGIGFAPKRWDGVLHALSKERISAQVGEAAGLAIARDSGGHYDRFRGRVMFPIRDVRGRIIGFGGRAIESDQEPKYLNTPETPIFQKRLGFFGFPAALEPIRRKGRAVVVEGYFDWVAMSRAGIEECVATCGTALTEAHAKNLSRRTRDIVLVFDGDAAGYRAMEHAAEILLPEALRVWAVLLPAGDDPDSLLRREGEEALRAYVDGAKPALEVVMREAVKGGISTPWEKADAVGHMLPFLAKVPDPVERAEFARRLALLVDTDLASVEQAVHAGRQGEPAVASQAGLPQTPRKRGPEERRCRELARLLIDFPESIGAHLTGEVLELFPKGFWKRLFTAMFELGGRGGEGAVERTLLGALPEEERGLLRSLLMESAPTLDAARVASVIEANLSWFRKRRDAQLRRAATQQLREDPGADLSAVLEAAQRHQEKRRKTQGL